MAGKDRGQTPDLKYKLLTEGRRYSFVQAIRMLRHLLRGKMGPDAGEKEMQSAIRVRPELSLAFPETDITSIKDTSGKVPSFLITATFLGLYGTSSPLPTFYTEDLLQEQGQDRSISRDFIDVINARIYWLYFKTWRRHRLFFNIIDDPDQDSLQRLFCLLGLENDQLQGSLDDAYGLLRYTGLVMQYPRSAEGLRAMLNDGLEQPTVRITQCIERQAPIPSDQRFAMGESANRLGENAYLGLEIAERMGKFRVQFGPLGIEEFERLMPDQKLFAKMENMIDFYLDQPLAWDVEVELDPREIETARLGESCWSRLGWNTWTFSGYSQLNCASVRLNSQRSYLNKVN
jgi:type VI secretion system protein ImpH